MTRIVLLVAAAGVLIACASTGRAIEAEALENCRAREGQAWTRCVEEERARAALEILEQNEQILDEIQRLEERGAMRRGEQAPRSSSPTGAGAPDHDRP